MANYYPPVGFHFQVNFTGLKADDRDAHFQSVSGLDVTMQTENIKEAGENRFEHELPVRTNYSDLTLKRGFYKGSGLIDWINQAFQNLAFEPVDLQVVLLNEDHEPLVTWDVKHAWPKKWTFSDLNAMQGEVFIETLQLHYNYFTVTTH